MVNKLHRGDMNKACSEYEICMHFEMSMELFFGMVLFFCLLVHLSLAGTDSLLNFWVTGKLTFKFL